MLRFVTLLLFMLALLGPLGDARTVSVQQKDTQPVTSHVKRPEVSASGATLQQHIKPKGYCIGCESGKRNPNHPLARVPVGQRGGSPSHPMPVRGMDAKAPVKGQFVDEAKPIIPPAQEAPGTETPFGRAKRAIEPEEMEKRGLYHGDDDHQWADDDHHHRIHPDGSVAGVLLILLIGGGVFFVFMFLFFIMLAQKRSRNSSSSSSARMVDLETRDRYGRTRHVRAIEREVEDV